MTNETIPQLTLDLPDAAVSGFAALLAHDVESLRGLGADITRRGG